MGSTSGDRDRGRGPPGQPPEALDRSISQVRNQAQEVDRFSLVVGSRQGGQGDDPLAQDVVGIEAPGCGGPVPVLVRDELVEQVLPTDRQVLAAALHRQVRGHHYEQRAGKRARSEAGWRWGHRSGVASCREGGCRDREQLVSLRGAQRLVLEDHDLHAVEHGVEQVALTTKPFGPVPAPLGRGPNEQYDPHRVLGTGPARQLRLSRAARGLVSA